MESVLQVNGRTIPPDIIARERACFAGASDPDGAARRSLAVRALLLDRAATLGWGGARSREEEDAVIARVLDLDVPTPAPTDDECRRYYSAHPDAFTSGEIVEARHILFAVRPGTPLMALRERAETTLAEIRSHPDEFANAAQACSNCPSAQHGGSLGQFGRGEMVPEFDRAVFGTTATGVLPRLVHTRYGFHVVEIVRRVAGSTVAYEAVATRIAERLSATVQARALAQYLRVLAGDAQISGVDLDGAASPLVQ